MSAEKETKNGCHVRRRVGTDYSLCLHSISTSNAIRTSFLFFLHHVRLYSLALVERHRLQTCLIEQGSCFRVCRLVISLRDDEKGKTSNQQSKNAQHFFDKSSSKFFFEIGELVEISIHMHISDTITIGRSP